MVKLSGSVRSILEVDGCLFEEVDGMHVNSMDFVE